MCIRDSQDVKTGDWFYPAVDFVTEKGLFHGTGDNKFSPNTAMTRGMFVTVLGLSLIHI